MATTISDVAWLIRELSAAGAAPIIAGGWGVDALYESQSRPHRDLDVLVQERFLDSIIDRLVTAGFVITTDWLPVRIELSDPAEDRHIDLHPVRPDHAGGWWQPGLDGARYDYPATALTNGSIGEVSVTCLTADTQLELHKGYEFREVDEHDRSLLLALASGEG